MSSKSFLEKIKPFIFNKYLVVFACFIVFVTFFDNHNLLNRWKTNRNIKQLEKDITHYKNEIEVTRVKLEELQSNDENLEKFAREQYLMKKENEDIFLVEE